MLISLHYCEGGINSITFFEFKESEKTCCTDLCCDDRFETSEDDDCCNSKTFLIEKKSFDFYHFEHKKSIDFAITSANFTFIPDNFLIIPSSIALLDNFIQSNAPPIYILLHKLLFYH